MSPQRRIALVSVGAAIVLIAIKLVTGLATGSLGLLSEAAHSGTDLVAALLTLFAVGVAVRPADRGHPYGHDKAEHLSALAEAGILGLISLFIAYAAVRRLVDGTGEVDATWWAFLVIGVVIAIDASRATVSHRAARRFTSPAFGASALHFAGDLAGSTAVLIGLIFAAAGYPEVDAIAALFVAALVLYAASRLIRQNVDVLMDQAPVDEVEAARRAIEALAPGVVLLRLRMRRAAGHLGEGAGAFGRAGLRIDQQRLAAGPLHGSHITAERLPGGFLARRLLRAVGGHQDARRAGHRPMISVKRNSLTRVGGAPMLPGSPAPAAHRG